MKASSHEKHSKQQWKNKKKSSDPWARSGERPGRGHGSELFVFFCFWFFHGFFAVWPKPQEHKKKKNKKSSDPWARSGLSTHKPKNQKTKKPKNQETKKPNKQKNKTKKPKKQKTQKNQKDKTQHSASDPLPLGCAILFFFFSCFFVFLVCVWIAQTLPMGLNVFFVFFVFSRFWPNCKKPWKKTKKTKNQETKKPNKTKNKKNKIAHPKGRGSDAECWVLSFCFFCFFGFFGLLVFCFFGFLVWIAIADVPSTDCQALSVVALEARSIHYSTAMFAMT